MAWHTIGACHECEGPNMLWSDGDYAAAFCAPPRYGVSLLADGLSSRGEGLLEEGAAEAQAFAVAAVADAFGDVPLDREPRFGKLLARHEHGIDGDDLIHVAMNEQNGGP